MQALSPTDSAFLWMETRNQPMHVAGLNIYSPPEGAKPDYVSNLLADWGKHLKALPPFNQRPVLRMGLWYWEEDAEFELDYHLRHLALPHPRRIRELLAMVSRLHGNLMDRNRPLWEAYVIEGLPGGRFATYTKIHHALIDGVSGAKLMADSLSINPKEHKPPVWAQVFAKPKPGPAQHELATPGLLQQLANGSLRHARAQAKGMAERHNALAGNGGQRDGEHEVGVHHHPAQSRHPERPAAAADVGPQPRPAHPQQRGHQRQRVERAAPERDLEAACRLQVPRHHARRAPHQRDEDHHQHGA